MSESTVLVEKNDYRVVARPDYGPEQPEWQGYPTVIIGWDRFSANLTESWNGGTDTEAILHAFGELSEENFIRWAHIFAEELLDREVLGLDSDEKIALTVGRAHGYSQGHVWMVLSWYPADTEAPNLNEDELVNWARGDAYFLTLEKSVTWTTDDPAFPDRVEWAYVDSTFGFFTRDPESLLDEAEELMP